MQRLSSRPIRQRSPSAGRAARLGARSLAGAVQVARNETRRRRRQRSRLIATGRNGLINSEAERRTDRRTDGRTDGGTDMRCATHAERRTAVVCMRPAPNNETDSTSR